MNIVRKILWRGRTGNDKTYFHPRVTAFKDDNGSRLLMTLQGISGSDYYHHVQQSYSEDGGESWSAPCDIPDMGRKDIGNGIEEGVCDVVPDYHEKTGKVLAIGHNVFYKGGKLYDTLGDFGPEEKTGTLQRIGVYSVREKDGSWSERKKIEMDEFKKSPSFVCGCSQKAFLPDGKMIIPFSIGYRGRKDRLVTSILCDFDGNEIIPLKKGITLENPVGRGLLEPSVILHKNKFFLTLRAEDDRGYLSFSDDGLSWKPVKEWGWDDGEPLTMSTTQQHWLEHAGKLYLVYTRKTDYNVNVFRWRSPLFISEFDPVKLCLIRESEKAVFPLVDDGIKHPENVPLMGNFQSVNISKTESIITDGDVLPHKGFNGDTLLAKIF